MLLKIINSQYLKFFVFAVMIITSINEVMEAVTEIGAQHGVLIFAVFQMLKVVSDFYEAVMVVEE